MRKNIVLTLTGTDRVGIVDNLTELLLEDGGNVETSRMARLGGEFAVLMLISMSSESVANLDRKMEKLRAQGYAVTICPTEIAHAEKYPGWQSYQIRVNGADHEGTIHEITHYLSQRGISVEAMDTEVTHAPISGSALFTMNALVAVPPILLGQGWQDSLEEIGHHLNVDVQVSAVSNP